MPESGTQADGFTLELAQAKIAALRTALERVIGACAAIDQEDLRTLQRALDHAREEIR